MAYLKQTFNGVDLCIFQFEDDATLGRHSDCTFVIDDPTISAHHANIEKTPEGYRLVDQGSTNGIQVKGSKLKQVALENGLKFTLGTCQFEYMDELPSDLAKTLKIKKSWIPGVYYTK